MYMTKHTNIGAPDVISARRHPHRRPLLLGAMVPPLQSLHATGEDLHSLEGKKLISLSLPKCCTRSLLPSVGDLIPKSPPGSPGCLSPHTDAALAQPHSLVLVVVSRAHPLVLVCAFG